MKKLILISCLLAMAITTYAQPSDISKLSGPYFGQKLSGDSPELFAKEILVKEKQAHSVTVFTKDGTEAYWCYNGIWSSKFEYENWIVPRQLPFSKKEFGDDAPFLSPDGSLLFFTSKRQVNEIDTFGKENIWVVDVLDSGWSVPRPLPAVINNMFQHWQFSVDKYGTIYFGHISSDNKNSDLYCSQLVNGFYQQPLLLKGYVNSELNEINPFISPDGDFLIFSRIKDRKPFNGGLFISYKEDSGVWTEAISLQDHINFKYGGNCPFVTQDGKYLFFLDVFDGKFQRYWTLAKFIEELKPRR